MPGETDFITLTDDTGAPPPRAPAGPAWKVAVIDDDASVHDGTRFALQDYVLNGRGLTLLSARSQAEGRRLLNEHPDTAVILLDVVMETENAGLDLVTFVREELRNQTVRIILRTGQPGQAPEQRVVVEYDINDYKSKTELTAEKLFTALTAALRSYEQLRRLVDARRGLEVIIDAASSVFDMRTLRGLAERVIEQLALLIGVPADGVVFTRAPGAGRLEVLARSGGHAANGHAEEARPLAESALSARTHVFREGRCALHASAGTAGEFVVCLDVPRPLSDIDRSLVEVMAGRLSAAFENVALYEQLRRANSELEARVVRRTRELSAANERLAARWARLSAANGFKNEILGKVAHDLKNPLSVILGRAEMLADLLRQDQPSMRERAAVQLEHIRESARRMTGMVDGLIADAMTDALDISVRGEPIDLAALAREVIAANEVSAGRKQQRIVLTAPPSLALRGDLDRLRETIDNLVSNAVKYTPVGGSISVGLALDGAEAVVTVADSGPGFSPEDMSRIFGRFQRLSAKPTAGETSTGLGLSIARRIVDLHAGSLTAGNGGPFGGAVFRMTLPLEPPAVGAGS